ncbi:MAG: HupE/UreJ family protein [Myxococcota bacterium]
MGRGHIISAAFVLAVILIPSLAQSHAFQPALLELSEAQPGRYEVLWKASTSVGETGRAPAEVLSPTLPDACEAVSPRRTTEMSGRLVSRWTVECVPDGINGGTIGVQGLEEGTNDVLVRFFPTGADAQTVVLNHDNRQFVPGGMDAGGPDDVWSVATTYLGLGVEHILLGFDHLLFVFGLLLLVRERRTLVATITAFTVAHSITLALSSLGVLTLSQSAVEAVIAASLMLLAVEALRLQRGEDGWTARAPWSVAFAFGLLHGFGFAGALAEIGLPDGELPVALAAFNVGVELGQLGVVALWVVAAAMIKRVEWRRPDWLPRAAAYLIGVPAAYWMIERISGILS